MSLFGGFLADAEDDPFFGAHMRHMRQMNNMMSSLFADPFGMMGGGPLAIGGPRHGTSLMPFMPQMPQMNINRLLQGGMDGSMLSGMPGMGGMGGMGGSSYSSSTVVMSSGPNGRPQVFSTTSSTKVGPNGIKETRKTLEDSRTGTKKMAVGHHIGERAHVIEREQNLISGDAEEREEYINLDEEEAEDFNREFQQKAGGYMSHNRSHGAHPQLALTAPPPSVPASSGRRSHVRPASRRPIRQQASPLALSPSTSATVRELYSSAHPQRHKGKHHRSHHRSSPDQH